MCYPNSKNDRFTFCLWIMEKYEEAEKSFGKTLKNADKFTNELTLSDIATILFSSKIENL